MAKAKKLWILTPPILKPNFSTTSIISSKVGEIISVMKTEMLMLPEKWYFKIEDNRNTSVYIFITEIIWLTLDLIIDNP